MIVIIPQHAHSARLPRKAFREICGVPLVAWSVIQAKCSHSVDAVYVSTESGEIAEICGHYGAEIIWRPKWLQDKAFAANVPIEHALNEIGINDKHVPFVTKLATAPLIRPDDIDRLHKTFVSAPDVPLGSGKQAILAAEVQEACVYHRMFGREHKMFQSVYMDKSKKALIPQGAMNVMYADAYVPSNRRAEWLLNSDAVRDSEADADMLAYQMILGNAIGYYVPCREWQTIDIDDEQGFEMAEIFMEHKILRGKGTDRYYEYAEVKSE